MVAVDGIAPMLADPVASDCSVKEFELAIDGLVPGVKLISDVGPTNTVPELGKYPELPMFNVAGEPDEPMVITPPPVLKMDAVQLIVEALPAVNAPVALFVKLALLVTLSVLADNVKEPLFVNAELLGMVNVDAPFTDMVPGLEKVALVCSVTCEPLLSVNDEPEPIVEADPNDNEPLVVINADEALMVKPLLTVRPLVRVMVGVLNVPINNWLRVEATLTVGCFAKSW